MNAILKLSIAIVVALSMQVLAAPLTSKSYASELRTASDEREGIRSMVQENIDAANKYRDMLLCGCCSESILNAYLASSFYSIVFAKSWANLFDGGSLAVETNDLHKLVELGFLDSWPLNPLNCWQPMKVLTVEDGFSAGDICFDLCPEEYYSYSAGAYEPISFNIFAYGVSPEPELPYDPFTQEINVWSVIPDGAMLASGYNRSIGIPREDSPTEGKEVQ